MKIDRLAFGLSVLSCLGACAQRAPEASSPAESAATSSGPTPPVAEEARVAAPASPAPAPQGLQNDSGKGEAADLDQELTTLESAERALNQAKADLDRLALAEPSPVLGRGAAGDGAAEKKGRAAAQAPKASAPARSAPSAMCENTCRAFSSLSRAANAVCRLDGDAGAHCARAKRVLADSQLRVASCTCPTG